MIVDLKQEGERFEFFNSKLNPSTGDIEYDDPIKNGPWMVLRPPGPFYEDRLAKRKRKAEHVFNPKTRAMDRIPYYPDLPPEEEKAEREALWDYCIVDFGGFSDKDGKEIEPTKQNKVAIKNVPMVDRFITRCFQLMANAEIVRQEEEAKN